MGDEGAEVDAADVEMIRNDRSDVPWSDHNGLDATLTFGRAPRVSAMLMAGACAGMRGETTRRQWLRACVLGLAGLAVDVALPGSAQSNPPGGTGRAHWSYSLEGDST